MTAISGTAQQRRTCTKCGVDVSGRKRFKDSSGHYYCESCYRAAQPTTSIAANTTAALEPPDHAAAKALGLLPVVTCPHCWHQFPPSQILWVAQHSDLRGDPVLGPEQQRRFLASRFTPGG